MEKLKSLNLKRLIKLATILFGFSLIIFISFYNAKFDFQNFNWGEWLANSSILVGIMIFFLTIGNSTGNDIQKEKVGGRFQNACNEYNDVLLSIEEIRIFFSQYWLKYKEKKLVEKKIDYLVNNQFNSVVAQKIINEIEKEDLELGKLLYDENKPNEKIYIKNDIMFKKLDNQQIELVRNTFKIKLDTFGESYYLYLFDDGDTTTNEAEKGKRIEEKIRRDKAKSFLLKIFSSLIISVVWSALTINDFVSSGGEEAVRKAWLNLLSRISAAITSYASGFSTSVINVRDQANAIENKTDILKGFKKSYDNKTFIPETYEEMLEREYKEQLSLEQEQQIGI